MKFVSILIFATLMVFAGCARTAVPVEIGKVCTPDNEKKYISTNGFLSDRGSIFCSNIGGGSLRCGLDTTATADGSRVFGADIEEGSRADEIEKLASGYKASDIKVHDNDGNIIKLSDKVKLTGQMSITPDNSVCFMTVDKIEKGD